MADGNSPIPEGRRFGEIISLEQQLNKSNKKWCIILMNIKPIENFLSTKCILTENAFVFLFNNLKKKQ